MIVNLDKIAPFISLGVLILMWYGIILLIKEDKELGLGFAFLGSISTIWVIYATVPFLYWL